MAEITNELLYEVLKKLQNDIAELKPIRHEMRDGFATMKSHQAAIYGEQAIMERRLLSVETDLDRIKKRLDLVDDSE